jgi:hypothetical protein
MLQQTTHYYIINIMTLQTAVKPLSTVPTSFIFPQLVFICSGPEKIAHIISDAVFLTYSIPRMTVFDKTTVKVT